MWPPRSLASLSFLPLQGATPPEAAHLQAVHARAGGLGAAAFSPEGAAAPEARRSRFLGTDWEGTPPATSMSPTLVALDAAASPASGLVFYTTGRLTSEMVIKSAQIGVPIVVSRSDITQMGYEIADRLGLALFGRATNKHFICYCGFERFDAQPLPAPPTPPPGV